MTEALQARMNELVEELASDPIVGAISGPDELHDYLQEGFSTLVNATLLKERALYLEQHPKDRGNGFAPRRELQVKTTPVNVQRPPERECKIDCVNGYRKKK